MGILNTRIIRQNTGLNVNTRREYGVNTAYSLNTARGTIGSDGPEIIFPCCMGDEAPVPAATALPHATAGPTTGLSAQPKLGRGG